MLNLLTIFCHILHDFPEYPSREIGYTPILSATQHGRNLNNTKLVEYLMDNGADITARGEDGRDLVDWAIKNENIRLIKGLINKGKELL